MGTFQFAAWAAAGLLAVGTANAASYTVMSSGAGDPSTGGSNAFSFADFDTSLGTLQAVSVSAALMFNAVTVDNQTTPVGIVQAPVAVTFSFSHGAFALSDQVTTAGTFFTTSNPLGGYTIFGSILAGDTLLGFVPTNDLSQFEGTPLDQFAEFGTVTINGSSQGLTFTSGGSGSTYNLTQMTSITYTYSPSPVSVPEPGTIALLGVGAVGLGFALRRRRTGAV